MAVRLDIISIGTLSRNRLWNETEPVRTPHATTTLVRSGKRAILVDPGLPAPILAARLYERTGMRVDQIDTIFLTNFRPSHRGGLMAFAEAKIYLHDAEVESARHRIEHLMTDSTPGDADFAALEMELKLLEVVQSPPDKIADAVDLFPLPGYTTGTCGLLVAGPITTTLIAGDAVVTQDHFLAGQVLPDAADISLAQASLQEVYEIADQIVPGHDNVFLNPRLHGA